MSRTGHNTEVSELTESELDNVSGGAVLQHEAPHAKQTAFTECHIFDDGEDLAMFCNRFFF